MARPKKKIVEPTYSLSLKLGNEVYESWGDTMLEALTKLNKPAKISLKGVLTVSRGDKKRTLLLMPAKLKRYFWKIALPYNAKRLAVGL